MSDKTNLAEFAKRLELLGIEIVSTGGTATFLRDARHSGCCRCPQVTNFPEILEGRVKTLHPAIHGGILANLEQSSARDVLAAHGIAPIGLVVINLYPFEEAVKKKRRRYRDDDRGRSMSAARRMLRAVGEEPWHCYRGLRPRRLWRGGWRNLSGEARTTTLATRRRLAAKAFARTAAYDSAIAAWFASQSEEAPSNAFFHHGHA